MNTKTVYQLDDEGFYVGETVAFESPLEPGIYHIPRGCVEEQPPEVTFKERPRHVGSHWVKEIIYTQEQIRLIEEEIQKKAEEERLKIENEQKRLEEERLKQEELQRQKELEEQETLRQEEQKRIEEESRQRQEAEQQRQREEEEKRINDILNRKKDLEEMLKQIQTKQIQYQQNNNEAPVFPGASLPEDYLTYLS